MNIQSKFHYLMSGLTGFIISFASTFSSEGVIDVTDILLAIAFGFLIVIFEYMRREPSPFFKDENDDNKKDSNF